jgi:transposase
MPKPSPKIELPSVDKELLEAWAKSQTMPHNLVQRAQIILLSSQGIAVKEVAARLSTYPNKIIHWRKRYENGGISALKDRPRSGRPSPHLRPLKEQVLELLGKEPPNGLARWDGSSLAERLGVSVHTVWAVLRREGIHLQRQRSWCISTDKDFAVKAADIVGLYLGPPLNAVVICVDEKPSMQALERKTGFVKTRNGKIVSAYKSTYKRHGTLNLFGALEVHSGKVVGKVTEKKKREDFIEFMDELVGEYDEQTELHVILDNYCTHKKNEDWLAKHPNVYFHFTPTSASWLNQVEIWFGIFTRKVLRNASFADKNQLREKIEAYIKSYNPNAEPFKWRKREVKGTQIKNNIGNLIN